VSTPSIEIRVLGELSVVSGTNELALPRSRKTRALLGYLSLTGRAHRREQLCDLLWDVTDDPRAALRWSLSKLRKVLEVSGETCLLATRTHVQVRLAPGALDLESLRLAARRGFDACSSDELDALASACRGELLEGLLLPDFDAFEAWLEAERAEARVLHGRLRRELVARHADAPERALVHARAWLARSGAEEAQAWVRKLSSELERRAALPPEPRPKSEPGTAPAIPAGPTLAPATAASATPAPVGPVAAVSMSLAAAAPAITAPARTRLLIGRDREISRLCLVADEVRLQRGGRIVLVLGEPGMGKTRLLEELRGRLGPLAPSALDVTFYEAERHRPLAPFLDAARELLPTPLPSSGDAAADREHLFETLSGTIRRGAGERGLGLLLLDDAHVADASSCELLHHVVRTASRVPLLTVLACRPAELDDNAELVRVLVALRRRYPVEEIHLQALPPEAVAALVEGEAPPAALEHLVRDSAGNPLVALEMARASATGGGVSRTLSDLVLARIAGLPEATGLLVRWASVLERGPVSLLEAACGQHVDCFMDALEMASRYALLRIEPTGTRFAMAHALIRRVVYESISPVRRAAMHRRVAEILGEGSEHGALIAHHATFADRPDLAARALIDGAERCARVGGVLEAAALAERASELVPLLEPALALTIELEALLVLGQVQRPTDPARFVTRLTEIGLAALDRGQPGDAHRAFHAASALRWEAGSNREGYGLARQAWQASRGRSGFERARGSSYLALCLALMEKQLPDAQALVFEAEAVARALPDAPEPTELVLARGQLHLHAGRLTEGRRDAVDARVLARAAHNTLQEAVALQMLMQLEHAAGDALATGAAAEALATLSTRMREGGEASMAAAGRALSLPDLGDARPALGEATLRLTELDDKRRLAWVANRWAQRERREGDRRAARALAKRALVAARAVEAQSEAAIATCELMATAADDAAYAAAEAALAELEADSTLSDEARRLIELVTKTLDSTEPLDKEPIDGARHR
jgi:hypothetical protein